jgi:site-specific recombinase XerD
MWSQHELIEVWRAACKRAGLVEVPLREGTRHSTATWLRESGAGLEVVQHLLGHTTSAHTQRYAQARPAELVRLVERLRYRTPSCSSE